MGNFDFLCGCCQNRNNCKRNNIVIKEQKNIKTIKCLDFIRDKAITDNQYVFDYKIRSDRDRKDKVHRRRS